MSLGNFVKSVQDIMRMDAGINGDAQRIEQMVWILFLKIFDTKEQEWELMEDNYKEIVPKRYQWQNWAADEEGITGDELLEFVDRLFKDIRDLAVDEKSDKRKVLLREFFNDSHNYMKSGTLLRQVINKVNELDFQSFEERHAFNDIYEKILKDLQSAGNAGEYYTPRPVTDFMIEILNPKIGEKVADFACGEDVIIVTRGKNAGFNRVLKLPQSHKTTNWCAA